MPCYRCGARQTDPARGSSPWRRGVRGDEQVLICPDCQRRPSWTDELDRCPVCGSTALLRRLGRTVCRDCEASPPGPVAAAPPPSATEGDRDLAREVAEAIDRVLGRAPG